MGSFIAGTLEHMSGADRGDGANRQLVSPLRPPLLGRDHRDWAVDNRTAGLRAVCRGEGTRVEHRQAGGDVNPYLAIAACLAGGIDGIQRGCPVPAPAAGDIHADPGAPVALPRTLEHALDALERERPGRGLARSGVRRALRGDAPRGAGRPGGGGDRLGDRALPAGAVSPTGATLLLFDVDGTLLADATGPVRDGSARRSSSTTASTPRG